MESSGERDETGTPSQLEEGPAQGDEAGAGAEPVGVEAVEEDRTSAARILEIAGVTADQLLGDARAEAESLVAAARAEADAIHTDSHAEAHQAAADLARRTQEQTDELDRERTAALAGLAEEKADLEDRIAALRQLQSDHQSQMRHHLAEQLSLLDATLPAPGVASPADGM